MNRFLFVTAAVALSALSSAQHAQPAPGFRLFGPLSSTDTWLVDTNNTIVHTWPSTFSAGTAVYLLPDGSLIRAIASAAGPGSLPGTGGGVQRVALDGTLLWDYRFNFPGLTAHHDITPMPNGNVLLIVWEDKTPAEAIAKGRDPATAGTVFRPDGIYEVQPTGPTTGQVVWSWHVWDHLIQDFDPNQAHYGVVANHPERIDINFPPNWANDWNHFNGIDYDPIHDWIAISSPRQNEVWIIDHSTTTAEAAGSTGGRWGKGGDLLYRWGNPQSYRAGTWVDQQLFFEHDPRFIPPGYPGEGNLTLFNNQLSATNSAAIEIVLPVDATGNFVRGANGRYGPLFPIWNYTAPGFASGIVSSVERLPNGNTLICSGNQTKIFEVTVGGRVVWEYAFPTPTIVFHAHYVERMLWAGSSTLSARNGGSIPLTLIAGTPHAGNVYLVLGSASGSSPGFNYAGVQIPLNPDWLLDATGTGFNTPMLTNTIGILDNLGRSTASLNVGTGTIPAAMVGTRLDFAFIVANPNTLELRRASNAVPITIVQ